MSAAKSYNEYDNIDFNDYDEYDEYEDNFFTINTLFKFINDVQKGKKINSFVSFVFKSELLSSKYIDRFIILLQTMLDFFEKNRNYKLHIYIHDSKFYEYYPFINTINELSNKIKIFLYSEILIFDNYYVNINYFKDTFLNFDIKTDDESITLYSKIYLLNFKEYGLNMLPGPEKDYFIKIDNEVFVIKNSILQWLEHLKKLLDYIKTDEQITNIEITPEIFYNEIFRKNFIEIILFKKHVQLYIVSTRKINLTNLPEYFKIAKFIEYPDEEDILFIWNHDAIQTLKIFIKNRKHRLRSR